VFTTRDPHTLIEQSYNYSVSLLFGLMHTIHHTEIPPDGISQSAYLLSKGITHNSGTKIFSDGSKYIGSCLDGDMHGTGVFTGIRGSVYTGSFTLNKKHGYCVMVYPEGNRYEGGFVRDMTHTHTSYMAHVRHYSGVRRDLSRDMTHFSRGSRMRLNDMTST